MPHPTNTDVQFVSSTKGRVFQFSHSKPYTTKDGREIALYVWSGDCKECGEPFEVITTKRNPSTTSNHQFDLVHCKAHRLSFREVCTLGRAAQKEKRREAKRLNPPPVEVPKTRIGARQAAILDMVSLVGNVYFNDLIDAFVDSLPPPPPTSRDRRREIGIQALGILLEEGLIILKEGIISPPQ